MKKTLSVILCSACAIAILGAPAKMPDMPQTCRCVPMSAEKPALVPLKSAKQRSANEVTKYVLVNEHFDGLKEGTQESPSKTPLMSKADYYAGRGISQHLLGGGSWVSDCAYSAGGAIALICPGLQKSGYINTPIGDYSGEITVSFRAKPLENNGQKKSYVSVKPFYGDYRSPNEARKKSITDTDFNLYANDENWTEVEIKLNNYSSNNDGYISIICDNGSAVLIDDLKITTTPSFIADPVLLPAEFGTNSVTARWQPVRRAFDYYLRLYKKTPVGEGDTEYEVDFDDLLPDGSNLPEGWTFIGPEFRLSENEGFDGSKGIILKEGDMLETFRNGAKYHNASMWIQSYYPSKEAADADRDAYVNIDVYKNGQWYPFACYYMGMLYDYPAEDDMETLADLYMTTFADRFEALRFSVKGSNCPEAYIVIDHFFIETGQPYAYELIQDNEGYDYSFVEGESFEVKFNNEEKGYPYHGLEKETDYAYSLQAHYLFEKSEPVFSDLAGVYMPEVNKPEEKEDGFAISWEPVYAADMYRVDNYGIQSLRATTPSCIVFDENFYNTACDVTNPNYPQELGNEETTDLSDYSDLPGWGGYNNAIVEGMMGFKGGVLITPLINLPNAEKAFVKIVYYASPGDVLGMTDSEGNCYYNECTGTADMNRMMVMFTIPAGSKPNEFTLRSMYGLPILIDNFTVLQDVKVGNKLYTYLGSKYVDAPNTSVTFDGLSDTGFTGFAYNVTALRESADGMLFSSPSNFRFGGNPDIFEGTSTIEKQIIDTAEVEGYYSVDGVRHSTAVKGVNIVRMSDGTVQKIFVK